MDFEFTDEQKLLKKYLREFVDKEVWPRGKELWKQQKIPEDLHKKLTELGLFGISVPTEYYGANEKWVTLGIVVEEICSLTLVLNAAIILTNVQSYAVATYGSKALKEELLPKIAKNGYVLGIACTEAGGGTDFIGACRTTVRRSGSELIINGEKTFISLATEAKQFGGGHLVVCRGPSEGNKRRLSYVYVPINSEGVSIEGIEHYGRQIFSTIVYDDVRVPDYYLVGEEGKATHIIMNTFAGARALIAVSLCGACERLLEEAKKYLKVRTAFGKPIGMMQGIQFQLAEAYARKEAIKTLAYRALWAWDEMIEHKAFTSFDVAFMASLSKLLAVTDFTKIFTDVMRWFGSYGMTDEYWWIASAQELLQVFNMAEGTNESQKIVIGEHLLGREFRAF